VEALGELQAFAAVPLLIRAARDPEPLVRRLVAEVAADVTDPTGRDSLPGQPVLRLLLRDADRSVRVRAAMLLGRSSPARLPAAASAPVPTPSPRTPLAPTSATDAGPKDAGPPPAPPDAGSTTPAGAQLLGPRPAPTPSPALRYLQNGIAAYEKKDWRQAKRLLQKASTLCASGNKATAAACGELSSELPYYLGRAYESQEEWAEAMTEFQKLLGHGTVLHAKAEHRSYAQAASRRLAPQLGQILVQQILKGKCQEVAIWMPPGTHLVSLGGQSRSVSVHAGETSKLDTCR
jgi:hypothetical protein